jgi:hypothetical protein
MKPSDPLPLNDPRSEAPALVRDAIAGGRARLPTPATLARLASRLPVGAAPVPPAVSVLPGVLIGTVLGMIAAVPILARDVRAPVAPPAIETHAVRATPPSDPVDVARAAARRSTQAPTLVTAPTTHPVAALSSAVVVASSASAKEAEPAPPPVGGAGFSAPFAGGGEDEPQLLQRAHALLAASPAEALTLTDEHVRRFPGGVLAQERELIAIEALLKLGRRRAATDRAASFLNAYPRSAHRSRVQALVAP